MATAGDLAREMKVSTARIAALLNKMEKKGLIISTPSSEDARKVNVEITSLGSESAEKMKAHML